MTRSAKKSNNQSFNQMINHILVYVRRGVEPLMGRRIRQNKTNNDKTTNSKCEMIIKKIVCPEDLFCFSLDSFCVPLIESYVFEPRTGRERFAFPRPWSLSDFQTNRLY